MIWKPFTSLQIKGNAKGNAKGTVLFANRTVPFANRTVPFALRNGYAVSVLGLGHNENAVQTTQTAY